MSGKEIRALSSSMIVFGVIICASSFFSAPAHVFSGRLLINYGVGHFIGSITMFLMLRTGVRP